MSRAAWVPQGRNITGVDSGQLGVSGGQGQLSTLKVKFQNWVENCVPF